MSNNNGHYIIKDAHIVNEGNITIGDVVIKNERIERIGQGIQLLENHKEIDAAGLYLFPGIIDDQVHFREPGLTHKGSILSESQAAVAGGVTSFMDMPNVQPPTITQTLLAEKYATAAKCSLANYSFYMGTASNNYDEVLRTNPTEVCGVKIFMGSSTGNMLLNDENLLEKLFANVPLLIATHCEDEHTIKRNLSHYNDKYGDDIPIHCHPSIRSHEACYLSTSKALKLATHHNTRLHVLHLSTLQESHLFKNDVPLSDKLITSEACIHHLWFSDQDYNKKGVRIKWNPAIKSTQDRTGLWEAVLNDKIDVIASDHAPHTLSEKLNPYLLSPSGGPLVEYSLIVMLECYHQQLISLEKIASKMSHAPAMCFKIKERGFIREGYFADLVLVDLNSPWTVQDANVLAKCQWSPFEGDTFTSKVCYTFVSGHLSFHLGKFNTSKVGRRLQFESHS